MKLLLASSGKFVTKYLQQNKALRGLRIAYITTALKGVPKEDRNYADAEKERMNLTELRYEEIDLDDYTEKSLREKLKDFDIIYVTGGNTFYLLKSVRACGFDVVIKELLAKGIFYIGASAGSYIMCPTIEMAGWKEADVFDHFGVEDLTALGVVPFLLKTHYSPEKSEAILAGAETSSYPTKLLTDAQALLVENGTYTLVGSGKEIVLSQF